MIQLPFQHPPTPSFENIFPAQFSILFLSYLLPPAIGAISQAGELIFNFFVVVVVEHCGENACSKTAL